MIAPRGPERPDGSPFKWDVFTTFDLLTEKGREDRTSLADAAREGDWDRVLGIVRDNPDWVNAARPGGESGFTPLHQAAYNGASLTVVEALLAAGAWRLLRTGSGELPLDIATGRRHGHLVDLLTPRPTAPVPDGKLRLMEIYFHAVINGRAADLVQEHKLRLPVLEPLQELPMRGVWMTVPGMTGGFHYWLARGEPDPLLVTESWSRVVGGSGQRHEITPSGVALVAQGFV